MTNDELIADLLKELETIKGRVKELIAALKASEARVKELDEVLSTGVDLIKGDKTGLEWKKACRNFIKDARAAQKGGAE